LKSLEIPQPVHEWRHRLIVDIDALDGPAIGVLEGGEGAPFVHHQRGRGVHCGNGKAGGQESHNRSNVLPGHGDLAG
jgi:hypothetical protein